MESQCAERLMAALGREAQLADDWRRRSQAIRHGRRDASGVRRHEQEEVVIVRVVVNAGNPGGIRQGRMRQGRQKRRDGQYEQGDQSPRQQPPEREGAHDQ